MNQQITGKQAWITVAITSLVLGSGLFGLTLSTQAQDQVSQDQNAALRVVAKMTEGQRTYYQKNGQFRAPINDIKRDFGLTLPNSFDYAVRTTSEAAYSYVIPAKSPLTDKLTAYVGGAFITPNQNPKITTIICKNTTPGQVRPADPQLVRGSDPANPTKLALQCGDYSTQVSASELTE